MKLTIRPLTPSLWPALESLFGKGGASNGCWCMYWRIGPEYHKRLREKNKSALHRIVKQGPPPGLFALHGERPISWCQLTPRQDLSWLNCKQALQAVDDVPVWAISCFYIRGQCAGTRSMSGRHCATGQYVKRVHRDSFHVQAPRIRTVARRQPSRPIMRHDLKGIAL